MTFISRWSCVGERGVRTLRFFGCCADSEETAKRRTTEAAIRFIAAPL